MIVSIRLCHTDREFLQAIKETLIAIFLEVCACSEGNANVHAPV